LLELAQELQSNIFIYDYSGYGLSSGKASVANVYADVEAAYDYLVYDRGIPASSIIAYGQSLGTAASVHLATTKKPVRLLAGVVLHSGLTSALRVIQPVKKTHWFDIFASIDRIEHVACPTMILHGTHDREIPVKHGKALYERSQQSYEPWWIDGAGHNDIEVRWRSEYVERISLFIAFATELQRKGNESNNDDEKAAPIRFEVDVDGIVANGDAVEIVLGSEQVDVELANRDEP
jgi:abhydrolase domain-containing protein 17